MSYRSSMPYLASPFFTVIIPFANESNVLPPATQITALIYALCAAFRLLFSKKRLTASVISFRSIDVPFWTLFIAPFIKVRSNQNTTITPKAIVTTNMINKIAKDIVVLLLNYILLPFTSVTIYISTHPLNRLYLQAIHNHF